MRPGFVSFTIALTAGFLSAQTSTNTVTVTASQSSSSQPDQALFSVVVTSGINQGLNDIVSALSGAGISAANLTGLGYSSTPSPQLQWNFQLTVPLSSIQATTAALTALAKSIPQANSSLSLSFSVEGTQNSGALTQSCDFAALMNNARAQAQTLAGAAGYLVGRVLEISSTTSQGTGSCSATVKFGVGTPTPHALEITSSRTITSIPDQAVLGITVNTPATAGLDDVTSLLAKGGFSGATLSSVYTQLYYSTPPTTSLEWSFTLTVPLSALAKTLAALTNPSNFGPLGPHTSFLVSIQSLQTSPQSQPACPQPALVADATTQAQALAAAAAVTAGSIDGISTAASAQETGGFASSILPVAEVFLAPQPTTCSMLVQFGLY